MLTDNGLLQEEHRVMMIDFQWCAKKYNNMVEKKGVMHGGWFVGPCCWCIKVQQ